MRALATTYVLDADGQPAWLVAGQAVPTHLEDAVRAQITSRAIIDGWDDTPAEAPAAPSPAPAGESTPLEPVAGEGEEVVELEEPPRSGPGSSKDAWAAYAVALGLDVEGLDRADIIAAVDALPEA